MELLILDSNFEAIGLIDNFESLIWTERYAEAGDFELYFPMNSQTFDDIRKGTYIWYRNSERLMIIEDFDISADAEIGNKVAVTGRSLESILDRRIIWSQTILTGNFQDGIEKILNENVISPSNVSRQIPNFIFKRSEDVAITSLTIDDQLHGDVLYDAVKNYCDERSIGFKILPSGTGGFSFELYNGTDRSYAQDALPWVEFSPRFSNLLTSKYAESNKAIKNVALSAGSGEGSDRKTVSVYTTSAEPTGLSRRELFVDAYSTSQTTDTGELSDSEYEKQLIEKGKTALSEYKTSEAFEAEIDTNMQFVYPRDFQVGDIVQIRNEYNIERRVRITEIVWSYDAEGEIVTPTFITLDEEEE